LSGDRRSDWWKCRGFWPEKEAPRECKDDGPPRESAAKGNLKRDRSSISCLRGSFTNIRRGEKDRDIGKSA